jgi:hypothetical protein
MEGFGPNDYISKDETVHAIHAHILNYFDGRQNTAGSVGNDRITVSVPCTVGKVDRTET